MISIILGDPHIGKGVSIGKAGIGPGLNSRIIDQLNILDWLLEKAVDLMAENIIITGDVFEEPDPPSHLISLFISWLKKCSANNVSVHIIMGNHDTFRTGNNYYSCLDIISEAEIENVHIYNNIDSIYINNFSYTFLPFRDRKSLGTESNSEALSLLKSLVNYELLSIPANYKKIIVGHLAIEGSIPVGDEIDDMTNELFCPISMFESFDYVLMGHVHKFQQMNKANPYIAHIGSMDISNFGESDQNKFIAIIDQDNDQILSLEKIPTRNLKKISITIPKDITDTTDYVIKELENNCKGLERSIVKIEISLESQEAKSIDKKAVSSFLNKKGVYNISNFSESKKISLIKKDNQNIINNSLDTLSAIKKYAELHIDEKNRSKYLEIAGQILNEYNLEFKE